MCLHHSHCLLLLVYSFTHFLVYSHYHFQVHLFAYLATLVQDQLSLCTKYKMLIQRQLASQRKQSEREREENKM